MPLANPPQEKKIPLAWQIPETRVGLAFSFKLPAAVEEETIILGPAIPNSVWIPLLDYFPLRMLNEINV